METAKREFTGGNALENARQFARSKATLGMNVGALRLRDGGWAVYWGIGFLNAVSAVER